MVAIAAGSVAMWGALAVAVVMVATDSNAGVVAGAVGTFSMAVVISLIGWILARRAIAPAIHASAALRGAAPELGVRSPDAFGDLLAELADLRDRLTRSVETHRAARREAEQTEAVETEFLTTVSHELRTPLNAILGFAQVLLDEIDGPLTESQREDVATIRSSGEMLRDLVDEVLDLAAMQSGRFALSSERVDPKPITREVARLLRGQRGGKPVEIETNIEEGVSDVEADPRRLHQILTNLGTNALKFTERGSVTFEVDDDRDLVRFTVRDTGSGIARADIAMIFEEFTQVGDVRRKSQGTGLGLAICKRLVDLHGGRIEVESVVGAGSAFHVLLPRWPGS